MQRKALQFKRLIERFHCCWWVVISVEKTIRYFPDCVAALSAYIEAVSLFKVFLNLMKKGNVLRGSEKTEFVIKKVFLMVEMG